MRASYLMRSKLSKKKKMSSEPFEEVRMSVSEGSVPKCILLSPSKNKPLDSISLLFQFSCLIDF